MPHAFNPHPKHPAVAYLLRLHADLGGRLLDSERATEKLREDMRHVEAVIRMFDPAHDVRTIAVRRRKLNPIFKRGMIFRAVLETLRTAGEPLTTSEICRRLIAVRDIEATHKQRRDLEGAVRASLNNHEGATVERVGSGLPWHWRLLGDDDR